MIAIETKHLPWTENRPARIKATAPAGQNITLSRDSLPDNDYDAHKAVALALCESMNWGKELVGGGTKRGMVWVFGPRGCLDPETIR